MASDQYTNYIKNTDSIQKEDSETDDFAEIDLLEGLKGKWHVKLMCCIIRVGSKYCMV